MYPRNLKTELLESAQYSPVILLNGARQTGKSTLALGLFERDNRPTYVTLDDITTLGSARSSPKSFVQALKNHSMIDEVQRAPELFLSIKEAVDTSGKTCRFFLTGSANVLSLPTLADSLAGRMEIFTLWSLSQGEIRGRREAFIDLLFSQQKVPMIKAVTSPELTEILTLGGFPDILERPNQKSRSSWFKGYLSSILERDVRQLSNIEGLTELPNLLTLIATRSGALLNLADLSRSLKLPYMTLKRYLALLETIFLVVPIQSWSNTLGNRLVKAPKLFLNDTGLLCHLLGRDLKALELNPSLTGSIFENFIVMELLKQAGWSETQPRVYHFRTADSRHEVDIVLGAPDGRVVGIECKLSSTVRPENFKGMKMLKEIAGDNFHRGIIIYTGANSLSFADKLEAVPVSALWETANQPAPPLAS
jgi:predicted AAA+ superfamily ATPase